MGKLNEIKTIHDIVMEMLKEYPSTRSSDNNLYVMVCKRINPAVINKPFWEVLASINDYGLPQYETVRRTRQKIQHEFPLLAGDSNVEAQRMLNQEAFVKYARGF